MTIQEKLLEKGFVEGVDYTLDNNILTAIVKTRTVESVIHHPEVLDEDGVTILQEASDEVIQVEEQYSEILPDLDSVKMECISDVAMVINEYLSDKKHLITEDDSINISEGVLVGWDFKNIPMPSVDLLFSLNDVVIEDKIIKDMIESKVKEGMDAEKDCNKCLQFIAGYNNDRLTDIQSTSAMQTFSGITSALQNRMPKKAKTLLLDISVDGTIITQELKDGCLYILSKYAVL